MSALSDGFVREFVLETPSKAEWQAQLRELWASLNGCFSLPAPTEAEFADMMRRHG
jgi:hypothetical protein